MAAAHVARVFNRWRRRVRHQDDRRRAAVRPVRRLDSQAERHAQRVGTHRARAHEVADASRRSATQPHVLGQHRRRRFRPAGAWIQPEAKRRRVPNVDVGLVSQIALQRASASDPIAADEHHRCEQRARRAGAERLQCGRSADWRYRARNGSGDRRQSRHRHRPPCGEGRISLRGRALPLRSGAQRDRHVHLREP